jgi:hypothetical protein
MSGPLAVPLGVAAFFVTNDWARVGLALTSVACAVFASYWVWRVEREKTVGLQKELDSERALRVSKERRREVQSVLSSFLEEGNKIVGQARNEKEPAPEDRGQDWLNRLCAYLEGTEELGPSYVVRLNNADGIPMRMTQLWSEPHRKLESVFPSACRGFSNFSARLVRDNDPARSARSKALALTFIHSFLAIRFGLTARL